MRAGPAVPPPSVLASPSRVRVPGPAARGGRCTDASRPWRCLCGLIRGSCARSPRGGRSAPLERRRGVFNASARSVDTGSSRMAGAPPGTGVGMQRRALTLPTCHPLAGAGLLPPGPQPGREHKSCGESHAHSPVWLRGRRGSGDVGVGPGRAAPLSALDPCHQDWGLGEAWLGSGGWPCGVPPAPPLLCACVCGTWGWRTGVQGPLPSQILPGMNFERWPQEQAARQSPKAPWGLPDQGPWAWPLLLFQESPAWALGLQLCIQGAESPQPLPWALVPGPVLGPGLPGAERGYVWPRGSWGLGAASWAPSGRSCVGLRLPEEAGRGLRWPLRSPEGGPGLRDPELRVESWASLRG